MEVTKCRIFKHLGVGHRQQPAASEIELAAGYDYNGRVIFYTTMDTASPWLLLISNLPGRNATVRMRLWRALKAAGAGMMRDGAYVLPMSDRSRQVFEEQSVEIKDAGGVGHIVSFQATSAAQNESLVALFDRTTEYSDVIQALNTLKRKLPKME